MNPLDLSYKVIVCFGTGDPTGGNLNLRESGEHTHFHSYTKENVAGHYHFDVTPEEIEYEGIF
jgi:hypothetical protein